VGGYDEGMDENPYDSPQSERPSVEPQSLTLWRSVVSLLFIVFGVIFLFAIVAEVVIVTRKGFSSLVVLHVLRDLVAGCGLLWAGLRLRRADS
jgi:hypothetical protein